MPIGVNIDILSQFGAMPIYLNDSIWFPVGPMLLSAIGFFAQEYSGKNGFPSVD